MGKYNLHVILAFSLLGLLSIASIYPTFAQSAYTFSTGGSVGSGGHHDGLVLKFSTDFEDVIRVAEKELRLPNMAGGVTYITAKFYGGGTESKNWIEGSEQTTPSFTPHSGTKCIGMSTTTTRNEFYINSATVASLGLQNQFYLSLWCYFPSDWQDLDNGYFAWLQVSSDYGAVNPYHQIKMYDGSIKGDGIVDLVLDHRNEIGSGQQIELARINNYQLPRGEWFHLEWFETMRTTYTARVMTWINGELLWDVQNTITLNPNDSPPDYYIEFAKQYCYEHTGTYYYWVDDLELYGEP